MSSTEATNGISRRAVLAGAAAIGGTIAVASALGTGVTTVQAAPSVAGTAGATGANGAGGVAVPAAQRTTKSAKTITDAPGTSPSPRTACSIVPRKGCSTMHATIR